MTTTLLPLDDPLRTTLHNEVHARPSARVRLPALIVYVAVLNAGVSREDGDLSDPHSLMAQAQTWFG